MTTKLEQDCMKAGIVIEDYSALTKSQKSTLRVKARRILDPEWAAEKNRKSAERLKKKLEDPAFRIEYNARAAERAKQKRIDDPEWAEKQKERQRKYQARRKVEDPEGYAAKMQRAAERVKQKRIDNPEWAKEQDRKAREKTQANLKKNLKIVNFLMNGNEYEDLKNRNETPFKKVKQIGNMVSTGTYMPSLHHVRYEDGQSHNKETSPAKILRRKSLNKQNIIEFMGCVPLHSSDHDWVHRYRDNASHGFLRDWHLSQWPWCIRTRENFMQTCAKYGLGPLDYDLFLNRLGA